MGLWKRGTPEVGDIVGYVPDEEAAPSFKRVIAVGPAEIDVDSDGALTVNGEPAWREGESLSALSAPGCGIGDIETEVQRWGASVVDVLPGGTGFSPVTVPPGSFYLLGDNRPASSDSRHVGPITEERILGVVTRVLWGRFLFRFDQLGAHWAKVALKGSLNSRRKPVSGF